MGCGHSSKRARFVPAYEDHNTLSSETPFPFDDGLIHREEFQLALYRNSNRKNLFADRVFNSFDVKRNRVIEFGEFVRSLSIFHPNTPAVDKIVFAFRLYDLRQTGFIEREELKEMVLALLNESDLVLSYEVVEQIVHKTFVDVDSNGEGKFDPNEWNDFVAKNPSLIKNMTLPYLKKPAWKAFEHDASYDSAVSEWLWHQTVGDKFPPSLTKSLRQKVSSVW